jgi:hypothetical protein
LEIDNLRETNEKWLKYVAGKGGETSQQLLAADIPAPEAVVEKFLHRGEMMILAGPPKAGKSVFVTQLSTAVTAGGKFLGEFQARRGAVIWYDIDDNDRHRAQMRLEDLGHDVGDENIVFFRKLSLITDGGVVQIDSDLAIAAANGQNVGLVIIDCLMGILGSGAVKNVVQDQRKQLEALRALAVKYNIGLVIIHHSPKNARKRADGGSVFDSMLGTTGIGTVVDVGVLLEHTGRAGEMSARFEGRNPDTPAELTLKLDRAGRTGWHVIEGADQAQEASDLGRVALGIMQVLKKVGARLTPTEIVLATGQVGTELNLSSVKVNCRRLVQRGILTGQGGRYEMTVTPVTAPTSDSTTGTCDGYSYGYNGSEQPPLSATVTPAATLELVPLRTAGTAVWSPPSLATDPPAAPRPLSRQKQPPTEPVSKAKPDSLTVATDKRDAAVRDALEKLGMGTGGNSKYTLVELGTHLNCPLTSLQNLCAHLASMSSRGLIHHESGTGLYCSMAAPHMPAVAVETQEVAPNAGELLESATAVEVPATPALRPEAATEPVAPHTWQTVEERILSMLAAAAVDGRNVSLVAFRRDLGLGRDETTGVLNMMVYAKKILEEGLENGRNYRLPRVDRRAA